MRFAFIQEKQAKYPIGLMCRILKVSRSGYYAWVKRPPSQRKMATKELVSKLKELHAKSRETYGILRLYFALRRLGYKCSRGRVAQLMKQHGIRAKRKRK